MKCEDCPGRFVALTSREDRTKPPDGVSEPELYCKHCGTKMVPYSEYWTNEYSVNSGKPVAYYVRLACPHYEVPHIEILGKSRVLKRTLKKKMRSNHFRSLARFKNGYGWESSRDLHDREE